MTFPVAGVNAEYAAPNGITYQYKQDGKKWVVKEYGPGIDTSKFLSITEFNQDQLRQDNSITALENKVSALEGSLFDGAWTFEVDDRIPRAGEFALRAGTDIVTADWALATQIIFNNRDSQGDSYTFEKVTSGDVIRCGAADGSGAEYKIISIVQPGWFNIEHIRSTPDAADEVEYVFTFFSSFDPAGLATINYVDAQDDLKLNLSGGTITDRLFFDRGSNGVNCCISPNAGNVDTTIYSMNGGAMRFRSVPTEDLNSGANTHIAFGKNPDTGNPETYMYHLVTPSEDSHAANMSYVNSKTAEYLPLAGGEMTGGIDVDKESGSGIIFRKSGTTNLTLWVDGTVETTKTTFSDNHLVTKAYVDSQSSSSNPPGLRFAFGNATSTVLAKKFNYYEDNGNLRMKISNTSQDVEWNLSPSVGDNKYGDNIKFSIYLRVDNQTWKIMRHGVISRIDQHSGDITCFVSSHITNGSFTANDDYFISIGGLF